MRSATRTRSSSVPRRAGFIAASLLIVAGCGSTESATPTDDRTQVVVTTALWADVVRNVACSDQLVVHSLIPDNADPHGYEPTFKDQELLDRADLVIENGRGLEHSWTDALDQVKASNTPVFTMADHVENVPGVPSSDPHIWLDPSLVQDTFAPLVRELEQVAGDLGPELETCIETYSNELRSVDLDITDQVATLPDDRRLLITNHDAFAYFAARYGFEVVDTILPSSSLSEANPADLDALEQVILERGISTVFAEHQHNGAEAEAIASRLGDEVDVVYLYTGTLGEPGSPAGTYLGLLSSDATAIVGALIE